MTTASTQASTATIARELVGLCRAGKNLDAITKLYATNIVSVEPIATDKVPAQTSGIAAVRGKNEAWLANNEIHRAQVKGPFVGDDQFAVEYEFETTFKPTGQRRKMIEMALYTVKDGKIVQEQFFYNPTGA